MERYTTWWSESLRLYCWKICYLVAAAGSVTTSDEKSQNSRSLELLFRDMDCVVTSLTNRTKCMITQTFYAKSVCVIKFGNAIIIKTVFAHNDLSEALRNPLVNTIIDFCVATQHIYPIDVTYLSTTGNNAIYEETKITNRNFMFAASFPSITCYYQFRN